MNTPHRKNFENLLEEIRDEVIALATDRHLFWKLQLDVIQRNARLIKMNSPIIDLINDSYAHAAAARIRRLLDRNSRTASLLVLLKELRKYPAASLTKLRISELDVDTAKLVKSAAKVKTYVDKYVAHNDRYRLPDSPTHRELNDCIEVIVKVFRKYYAAIAGGDLDVVIDFRDDPLKIFEFPWIEPPTSKARNS
jgi:hypothetical protein